MSPTALALALEDAKRRNKLPKAAVVVSLYGQSADMDAITEICDRYGVPVVEDAAESLGATYKGRPCGTLGRLGIYSFNGNKIITTSGGGALVTGSADEARKARFLATQARDPVRHYQHSTVGYNYRMSNVLAGVGRGQLQVLDDRVAARRRVFQIYREQTADLDWISWMPEPDWSFSTHWLSVMTVNPDVRGISPSDIIDRLAEEFIEARPVWKPMHLQPIFRDAAYFPHANTSVSEDLFARGVCLPSGSNLTDQQIGRVIDMLRDIRP